MPCQCVRDRWYLGLLGDMSKAVRNADSEIDRLLQILLGKATMDGSTYSDERQACSVYTCHEGITGKTGTLESSATEDLIFYL